MTQHDPDPRTGEHPKIISILMLEDEDDDWVLTQQSIKSEKLAVNLYRVSEGGEGLAVLRGQGDGFADTAEGKVAFKNVPCPDLIICDLYMHRMDGREFLRQLKSDPNPQLHRLPVVVLTNSRDEHDVVLTYDLGAAAYIVKPLTVAEMAVVVRQIRDFFLSVVRLPGRGHT